MTTLVFNNMDAYEAWTEKFENASDYEMIPTAINDGWKVSVDMFTECKSWKTALRRFLKAFKHVNRQIDDWVEEMREACENKIFSERDNSYPEGGCFSWGVEETMEGYWYIFLNISGVFAE